MNITKKAAVTCVMLLAFTVTGSMLLEPVSSSSNPSLHPKYGYPSVVDMRPFQQAFY